MAFAVNPKRNYGPHARGVGYLNLLRERA